MSAHQSFFGSVRRFFRDYITLMAGRGSFGNLVQRASEDAQLRRRLIESPNHTLAAEGVKLPEGLEVEVYENTADTIHLVLPPMIESSVKGGDQ